MRHFDRSDGIRTNRSAERRSVYRRVDIKDYVYVRIIKAGMGRSFIDVYPEALSEGGVE